jgi:ubiquinone/menaquinone biosynthesis C-methylase UbiE
VRKFTEHDFNSMVHFFDQMAMTTWFGRLHQALIANVAQDHQRVLDIGCGTGRLLLRLLPRVELGIGVDLAPEMIKRAGEIAREQGLQDRLQFLVGDAYALPFEDEQFDLVVSTCVLFLLPDPSKGMLEAMRVLKKGGVLLTLNPSERMSPAAAQCWLEQNEIPAQEVVYLRKWADVSLKRNRMTRTEMKELLAQIGFERIEVIEQMDGLAHLTLAYRQE